MSHRLRPIWWRCIRRNHGPRGVAARQRGGFTLIELMITILIIAILASLVLGALARAGGTARVSATRSRVAKLHSQIALRYESYRTRRLPIDPATALTKSAVQTRLTAMGLGSSFSSSNSRQLAGVRLLALRELMRTEMPQSLEDITVDPEILDSPPALQLAYRRRLSAATSASSIFEQAECLYMIVTMGMEDNNFGTTNPANLGDVGDKDGDGLPEFHDAWGNVISFLRWAPGFASELQPDADPTTLAVERDPRANPDPFDPLKLDVSPAGTTPYRGFALYPLVYSGGPDEVQDIQGATASTTASVRNDPYDMPSSAAQPGTPLTSSTTPVGTSQYADNIHNHFIQLGGR